VEAEWRPRRTLERARPLEETDDGTGDNVGNASSSMLSMVTPMLRAGVTALTALREAAVAAAAFLGAGAGAGDGERMAAASAGLGFGLASAREAGERGRPPTGEPLVGGEGNVGRSPDCVWSMFSCSGGGGGERLRMPVAEAAAAAAATGDLCGRG
jgi:hypothetical protein